MYAYKWIWQYIRKYRFYILLALFMSLITAGLALVNPFISGIIIRDVFQGGMFDSLKPLIILMIAVTFLKTCIRYSFLRVLEWSSQSILLNIRLDIYRRIQEQSFSFFDSNRVGDIMSRMTGDLDAIRHFIAGTINSVFENIIVYIIAMIIIFTISWQIALAMLVISPVIAITAIKQSKEIKPTFSKVREQFSRLNSVCQENISGNRVVKAFTKEDYEIEKFSKENDEYFNCNVRSSMVWAKYLPVMEFCANLLFIILILFGGILVILGKIELWKVVTINGYLWAVNNPLRMTGWIINDIQRFNSSLDKIFDMMRKKVHIKSPENPFTTERVKGKVEFKNVSFCYDKHNQKLKALKNISFTAEPGYTVGIVGSTGSGKTTLINLISRFYDATSGQVLVDDIDVAKYDLQSLRKDIAAATQDIFLFSDTVEGNIAYGVPETPMEKVIAAAKTADADDFINHMDNGYDTIIGERGVGLSGGQKQRIALARAIAVDPSILILDDTTSAVDMETEHEIQQALKQHYSDRTKFIIAHRISSVKSADLILVMENGEIIENGTHDALLQKEGYYYSLFINQYGSKKEA